MTTQYILNSAGFLIGVMSGATPQENSTTIPPVYTDGFTPQFVNGAWLNHSRLPVLTPPQFRMLYTSAERIAIRTNLASAAPDPVISDFFTELNDPQLREVDLNLASVQGAIQYSINFVAPLMNPRYATSDIARRVSQMMTGVPQ